MQKGWQIKIHKIKTSTNLVGITSFKIQTCWSTPKSLEFLFFFCKTYVYVYSLHVQAPKVWSPLSVWVLPEKAQDETPGKPACKCSLRGVQRHCAKNQSLTQFCWEGILHRRISRLCQREYSALERINWGLGLYCIRTSKIYTMSSKIWIERCNNRCF